MALQTEGPISLNDIHIEAGGTTGTNCTINDSDIRGLIGKASGITMSFNEWYGASGSAFTQPFPDDVADWNVYVNDQGTIFDPYLLASDNLYSFISTESGIRWGRPQSLAGTRSIFLYRALDNNPSGSTRMRATYDAKRTNGGSFVNAVMKGPGSNIQFINVISGSLGSTWTTQVRETNITVPSTYTSFGTMAATTTSTGDATPVYYYMRNAIVEEI